MNGDTPRVGTGTGVSFFPAEILRVGEVAKLAGIGIGIGVFLFVGGFWFVENDDVPQVGIGTEVSIFCVATF